MFRALLPPPVQYESVLRSVGGVNTPDEARAIIREQCEDASASLNGRTRYLRYKEMDDRENNVSFGGRLAEYRYYDMAPAIESAMRLLKNDQIPVPLLAANLEKPKCDR